MRSHAYIYEMRKALRKRAVDVTKSLSPALMEQVFSVMAGYFSVLSESSRLRIMYAICGGEKSVSEVLALCGSSQANISRQLTALHKAGIVSRRKEGVTVYYAIADEATVEMCKLICAKIAQELH